ncbi:hypothetical protein QTG54_011719 [Skeletonema marinoi]|uniref:Uncharacterized protein n=1 Tax=Skeletonema marinoi TaxID=267567 RepID=A0AAD8Y1G5_9STRA|nr:hypothetical protein QTG54_011719 [Skeletonema marinoi]
MTKDTLLALTVASLSLLIVTAEQDAHSSSTSIPTFSSTHVQTWTLDLDDKTVANDGDDDYTPSPTSFVTSVLTSFHTMVVEENDDDGTYLVGGGVVFSSQLQTQEPNDMRRPESRKPSSSPITKSPIPIEKDDRDINIIAAAAASTDEEHEVGEEATEEEKKRISTLQRRKRIFLLFHCMKNKIMLLTMQHRPMKYILIIRTRIQRVLQPTLLICDKSLVEQKRR